MTISIKAPERKQTAGNALDNANLSVQVSKRPSKAPFFGCFLQIAKAENVTVTESTYCILQMYGGEEVIVGTEWSDGQKNQETWELKPLCGLQHLAPFLDVDLSFLGFFEKAACKVVG